MRPNAAMNPRMIGFLSVLALLFHVHAVSATTNALGPEPALDDRGYGTAEYPADMKLAGDQSPSSGATTPGASSPVGESKTPVSDLQQCKIGCAPQCNAFGNADLAEQCRESCEAKCDAAYGKK